MEDRFKLRIFDKEENKYITWAFLVNYKDEICITVGLDIRPHLKICENQERFVKEQCTGLKDKNGKLIYEGDILSCGAIVVYRDYPDFHRQWGYFLECTQNHSIKSFFDMDYNLDFRNDTIIDIEIIGNIYENKKLLEVQNG